MTSGKARLAHSGVLVARLLCQRSLRNKQTTTAPRLDTRAVYGGRWCSQPASQPDGCRPAVERSLLGTPHPMFPGPSRFRQKRPHSLQHRRRPYITAPGSTSHVPTQSRQTSHCAYRHRNLPSPSSVLPLLSQPSDRIPHPSIPRSPTTNPSTQLYLFLLFSLFSSSLTPNQTNICQNVRIKH